MMNTPNLNALEGKWFILYSNFPMWTKGRRDFPSLNYEILQTTSKYNILDHVEFQSKGRHKVIRGFDHHLGNGKFIWRGKGVLSLLRCNWQIVNFQQTWMLIHFKKTLFTPSGYDLVAREPIHIEKYRLELMERKLNLQKIAQNAAT